jgi:GH24 family phage-related lysozyme (muramidase)
MNHYSYVYNTPINYTDPTGHDPWWCNGDENCMSRYIEEIGPAVRTNLKPMVTRDVGGNSTDIGSSPIRASDRGISFIKKWEDFEPNLYNDDWNDPNVQGNCTIGYGTLVHIGECDGREAEQQYLGGITEEQATDMLIEAVEEIEVLVVNHVNVPLNQHQFDALVSFGYNVGGPQFISSDLVERLNREEYDAVPSELLRWVYPEWAREGLTQRRIEEGSIFSQGIYAP